MLFEIDFKGSVLETEIKNINVDSKKYKFKILINNAYENQPNSLFWKQAFEMINKK